MKRVLLVLSLLTTMAQAIETALIKDADGVEFTLNKDQKKALLKCSGFADLGYTQNDSMQLDYFQLQKDYPFATQKNILDLLDLLKDNSWPEKGQISDIFKLAYRWKAPKLYVDMLADKLGRDIFQRKISPNGYHYTEQLDSNKIPLLTELEEKYNFGAYAFKTVAQAAANKKKYSHNNHFIGFTEDWHNAYEQKKWGRSCSYPCFVHLEEENLGSLEGLEQAIEAELKEMDKSRETIIDKINKFELNLNRNRIRTLDLNLINRLQKKFPGLNRINLSHNSIRHIEGELTVKEITIDLTGNPISSIQIKNPEQATNVTFKVENVDDTHVEFIESGLPKHTRWIRSLAAQTRCKLGYYLPTLKRLGKYTLGSYIGCLGINIGSLITCIANNEKTLSLVMNQSDSLAGSVKACDLLANQAAQELAKNIGAGVKELFNKDLSLHEARKIQLLELPSLFSRTNLKVTLGMVGLCLGAEVLAKLWHSTDLLDPWWEESFHPHDYCVRVNDVNYDKMGAKEVSFPSKYEHKLFGKNGKGRK